MPVGAPIGDDGAPDGPQLVLEVANVSARDLEVGYEFDAGPIGGGGGGSVGSCELAQLTFGTVQGHYTVTVDGNAVHEADVPPFVRADAWILLRVNIDSEGGIQVQPPALVARAPVPGVRAIPDCG